ncbi:MAG: glutaredoxin family protein [Zoogloeaceae bacterium]|jgi:glutaredoxin|nr:glutaredoxin family protein [Zoogloeaceae bacterium]
MIHFRLQNIVLTVLGLYCALFAASLPAQTWRWIDPATGRTMYTDTAPPGNAKNVVRINASGYADDEYDPDLPYTIRMASEKYPVVLYVGTDCDACKEARDLLNKRSVPFTEKVVQSEADQVELSKLVGDTYVPSVLIGRQKIRGFDAASYHSALDLAGYPKVEGAPAAAAGQ